MVNETIIDGKTNKIKTTIKNKMPGSSQVNLFKPISNYITEKGTI